VQTLTGNGFTADLALTWRVFGRNIYIGKMQNIGKIKKMMKNKYLQKLCMGMIPLVPWKHTHSLSFPQSVERESRKYKELDARLKTSGMTE